MRYRKLLLSLMAAGLALVAIAAVTSNPAKYGAFISSDGSGNPGTWVAVSGSGAPYSGSVTPAGLMVSSDGSGNPGTWVAATSSNFGGGGSGTGVWSRRGPVLYPKMTVGSSSIAQEASVIPAEANPVVLTNYTKVWKMWANMDGVVCYYESADGINNWTMYTGGSAGYGCVLDFHSEPNVIKNGSTYYLFAAKYGTGIDAYTSTDGVTFTLLQANVVSGATVSNTGAAFVGGTLYLFVEGANSGGTAIYTATSPYTGSYTFNSNVNASWKGPTNPVQIGSTWWMWYHSDAQPASNCGGGASCSQLIRASAPAITGPWTNSEGTNSDFWPQTIDEEGGAHQTGQVADPFVVEYNGKTYLYYSATASDASSTYTVIKLATANMPLASVVNTTGGGTAILDNRSALFGIAYNPSDISLDYRTLNLKNINNITGLGNINMAASGSNIFGSFSGSTPGIVLRAGGGSSIGGYFQTCVFDANNCATYFLDWYGTGAASSQGTVGHGWHLRGGRQLTGYDNGWFDTLNGQTYAGFYDAQNYPSANVDVSHFDTLHSLVTGNVGASRKGAVVSSASTISVNSQFLHVSGTTQIATINPPYVCVVANTMCQVTLIPDGAFTTTATGGNIALGSTAVVNKALIMSYDPAVNKWYPSY